MRRLNFLVLGTVSILTLFSPAYTREIAPALQRGEICLNGEWQAMAAGSSE